MHDAPQRRAGAAGQTESPTTHGEGCWRPNVTVAAVVERDGRFLVVEEHAEGRTVINQPAGHLERGESLLEAVRRETLEETAWHFQPSGLVGIYRWPHPERDITYLRFAFTGELLAREQDEPLDPEIHRCLWMSEQELGRAQSRLRSPQVMAAIRDYRAGRLFPIDCLRDLGGT